MSHDRERSSELASMRRPHTADDLIQFLQAVTSCGRFFLDWQRLSSPFECCWRTEAHEGNSTPDQASRVESGDRRGGMKREQMAAWSTAQDLVANAVA